MRKKGKKAMEGYTLIGILIGIVSFFVLSSLIYSMSKSYDVDQEIALTRASLFAAEKLKLSIGDEGQSINLYRPDFYLRTHSLNIPETGYTSSKEEVMQNLAERIADCWWEFGSGEISENVLDQVFIRTSNTDKCFVCFLANIKKLDTSFYFTDLLEYIATNPYKAKTKEKEICTGSQDDPSDCLPASAPECEVKGGTCKSHDQGCDAGDISYQEWSCPAGKQCCINQEKMLTYLDYLQYHGGVLYFPKEMYDGATKEVREGMTYAIVFKDKSRSALENEQSGFFTKITEITLGSVGGLIAAGPLGLGVGFIVTTAHVILEDSLSKHMYPQGVIFAPYDPSGESYGNCELVDES